MKIKKEGVRDLPNKNNSDHSIKFEAINYIIHICNQGVNDHFQLLIATLGSFLDANTKPNFQYLGLDACSRACRIPEGIRNLQAHQAVVIGYLSSPDISIRMRALDLLYALCDSNNVQEIVQSLLTYLKQADHSIREDLVLKIADLAERYATNYRWYIDVVLKLISEAGDFVAEEIWFRVVQVVKTHPELSQYAASTCYNFLQDSRIHQKGVKVGAYVLGEFGHAISETAENRVTALQMFDSLQAKFVTSSFSTKLIILNAYMKLVNAYPEEKHLKQEVVKILTEHTTHINVELQQRAIEYLNLLNMNDVELLIQVWDEIPPYPERPSGLQRRLEKKPITADRDTHKDDKTEEEKKRDGDSEAARAGPTSNSNGSDDEGAHDGNAGAGGAAQTAPQMDFLDIMGMGVQTITQATHTERPAAQAAAAMSLVAKALHKAPDPVTPPTPNLLGLMGVTVAPTPTPASTNNPFEMHMQEPPPRVNAASVDTADFFPAQAELSPGVWGNCESDKQVIYESSVMQATIQLRCAPPALQAVLMLRVRGPAALAGLVCVCPPDDLLSVACQPEAPFDVSAQTPGKLMLVLKCRKPFPSAAAAIQLRFSYQSSPVSLTLKLPVYLNHYAVPASPNKDQFIGSWQKLADKETKALVDIPAVLTPQLVGARVAAALKMGVLDGVNPNPASVTACASFNSIGVPGGQPVTMPMMLLIEVHPSQAILRVTTRCGHPGVSAGLLQALLAVFQGSKRE